MTAKDKVLLNRLQTNIDEMFSINTLLSEEVRTAEIDEGSGDSIGFYIASLQEHLVDLRRKI